MVNLINETEEIELAETFATAAIQLIGSFKDMLDQDFIETGIFEKWGGLNAQKNMADAPLLKVFRN